MPKQHISSGIRNTFLTFGTELGQQNIISDRIALWLLAARAFGVLGNEWLWTPGGGAAGFGSDCL